MKKRHNIYGLGLGLSLLVLRATGALANPEGGQVAAGQASITSSGSTLTIDQTTDRAVIDWQGFDIAPDEHTEFRQPSDQSFTLNRVRAGGASQIDGKLTANGRIAIVNPQGVYFGRGAQVDVGGLVATTADIDTQDFMENRMNFSSPGMTSGRIVNDGRITAREAGLVGLVAPDVENNGIIEARLGRVALASGDHFTLDMTGDGLIQVGVSGATAQKIINTGLIQADGGHVALTAGAARETVDSLIVNRGTIEANSVGSRNGKIILSAAGAHQTARSGTSTVLNEGTLSARGDDPSETGGDVHMLGDHVGVMSQGRIDVSGHSGGGQVLVGGDFQGGGDVPTARRTYIDSDAYIYARAEDMGDGGRVIVWADDVTRYGGHIDVRGGDQSGDGGFIEVSGKEFLDFTGTIAADAQNGEMGTLLLDPTDITISNAAGNNINGATPFSPTVDNGPSNLNVGVLQTALAGANVTVQTRATGAQPGNITVVDPISWTANRSLTLDAHNKIFINAPITARNNLTLTANDVDINANLNEDPGGATLVIQPKIDSTTIGIAGGAGTLNLSTADLNFIQSGWNSVTIGSVTGTGQMTLGARTWNAPTVIRTLGDISVTGAQAMGGNALTLNANTLDIGANLTGTNALTLSPLGNTSVGLAGGAGTFNLTTTELNRIQNGFSAIAIGNTTSNQNIIANAHTWNDPLTLRTGNADIQIAGIQTMGSNALTLSSRTIDLAANLTGTGTLTFTPDISVGVGLAGGAGTYNLTTTELNRIQNGFSSITIGLATSNQPIILNAHSWNDPLSLRTGNANIQIDGNQTMSANNLTLSSRGLALNADLIGTGTVTLRPDTNASVGILTGTGTYQITSAILSRLLNWGTYVFGLSSNNQPMEIAANTWTRPNIQFFSGSGAITVNGNQTANNNLLLRGDGDIVLNGNLSGPGTLTIGQSGNTSTMGLAGASGTVNLSVAELNRIQNGWNQLVFGTAPNDGAFNIGAYTWQDNVRFQNDLGIITISGAQNTGTNNLTIHSDGNPNINAALTGTGTLTFEQDSGATTFGIAGGTGTFNISTAELANITDGWGQIVFGRTDQSAAMDINSATWNDHVRFQTGSGAITINGTQDAGTNNLTIRSDGNPVINSALTGTGILSFETTATGTTMGIAGAAGTYNLSSAELGNITDGWGQIVIGRTTHAANMILNTHTWNDSLMLLSNTGVITVNGAQNLGANNLTIRSDGNPAINAGLNGTGTLLLDTTSAGTTIGVAGAAGSYGLSTADLNNISNGWSDIIIGRLDGSANYIVNAYSGWNDPVTFRHGSGVMTIAGAQNMGANNLSIIGDSVDINSALTGSGILTLRPSTASTTIGLAGGAGTFNLATAELNNIADGWSDIVVGQAGGTGLFSANAHTWSDNLRWLSGTGQINAAGLQNLGGNDLTITTNSNVTGDFQADDAVITTGAGTVTATASFTTLNVTGAGVTLTPGYIGAPGPATQTMANLIRVGGVLLPTPSPNFMFGTFEIGYVPPPPPVSTAPVSAIPQQDIVRILRQPQAPPISWGDTFFSTSTSPASGTESGTQGLNNSDTPRGWTFLVDDVLTISPELEAVIIPPGQDISSL